MKLSLLVAALIVSTGAYAQDPPKLAAVGAKPIARVKPKPPAGCTLIGTVRGTKLWAGDCAAPDQLRTSVPGETPLPDPATTGALPSEQK